MTSTPGWTEDQSVSLEGERARRNVRFTKRRFTTIGEGTCGGRAAVRRQALASAKWHFGTTCMDTVQTVHFANMAKDRTYGAEEARAHLPELLERAKRGEVTVITKHGRPLAKVVPVHAVEGEKAKMPILSLAGSGRGLWGRNSRRKLKRLREEW
jgi:prevent-host-death family protein